MENTAKSKLNPATVAHHGRPMIFQIGCTSFSPAKSSGGYGDGGDCFLNDDELAEKIRRIGVYGQDRRYYHHMIGVNGCLHTL